MNAAAKPTRKQIKNALTFFRLALIADARTDWHAFVERTEIAAKWLGISLDGLDRAGTIAALRTGLGLQAVPS